MAVPVVSIVIPCYNDAQFIEQAVRSALDQTYPSKEVIVVDDGSNDETKTVLKKLEPSLTALITQENKGQSVARNKGVETSRGKYILALDSDDYFEKEFCEKAVEVFENNTEIKIVSCHVNRWRHDKISNIFIPHGGRLGEFLNSNGAMGSSMFRKLDWQEVGGYDEGMNRGFEDWEFFIRLLKDGGESYIIPEILFNYRLRNGSTSSRANKVKYDLLRFIYSKHRILYIQNFDSFIDFLLRRIEREEKEKIKNTKRLEFILGTKILQPLRFIKSFMRS